jgi:hypothetical protein
MPKFHFTRRIIIGLAFIYLAGLGWGAELIIPFTSISHKGLIWIGVFIAAEISFVAGVAILGKPIYVELKTRLQTLLTPRLPPRQ